MGEGVVLCAGAAVAVGAGWGLAGGVGGEAWTRVAAGLARRAVDAGVPVSGGV
jgi:hypothetical protein